MAPPGASWSRILRCGGAQLLLLSLSLLFLPVRSRLMNVTVDDTQGDTSNGRTPQYANGPDDSWNAGSPSENCGGCRISPANLDLTQVHDKTWHETTFLSGETPISITVSFTGTAVYVFNILANTLSDTVTTADITFSIDGENVGHFARQPDSSTTFLYNQLVFSSTVLSNGPHTLVMTPSENSLIVFDYLVYTVQVEDPTTSSSTPTSTTPRLSSPSPDGTPSSSTSTSSTSSQSSSSSSPGMSTSTSITHTQSSSSNTSNSSLLLSTDTVTSTLISLASTDSPQSPSSAGTPTSATSPNESSRSPSSSSRMPVGPIVGAALGGIALLLGAVLAILLLCRRCKRSRAARTQLRAADGEDASEYGDSRGAGDRVGDRASFVHSMVSTTSISPLRFHDGAATHRDSHPGPIASLSPSTISSPDGSARSALRVAIPNLIPMSPSVTSEGSRKPPSRAELAWRLEALQHTRSALSTPDPTTGEPRSDASGGGTERAIRDLEAEIADLRAALTAMNARLEDEQRGGPEWLPAYAE